MKQQRLLKLSIVFLIPLTLLAALMATVDLAGPAAASEPTPAEFLPSAGSDSLSIVARRAISIPFILDDSALPLSAGSQIAARRVISIPYMVDNSVLPPSAGGQAVGMTGQEV